MGADLVQRFRGITNPSSPFNGTESLNSGNVAEQATTDFLEQASQLYKHPSILANPAFAKLKLLKGLSSAQQKSIKNLEDCEGFRSSAASNRAMFETIRDLPKKELPTLERQPSFLLVTPILDDIKPAIPSTNSRQLQPAARAQRALWTAQAAFIHAQIKSSQAQVLEEANAGARLCPLTLNQPQFASFLEAHETDLQDTIAACGLQVDERNSHLEAPLGNIAHDYLAQVNKFPETTSPLILDSDRDIVPAMPTISVKLEKIHGMPDHHFQEVTNEAETSSYRIVLPTDSIDRLAQQPPDTLPAGFGWSESFAHASVQVRTAAIMLQHLFYELARIEQDAEIRKLNDFSQANGALARTLDDKLYEGSKTLGDRCQAKIGKASQREESVEPLSRLRKYAFEQQTVASEPLLNEPTIQKWLTGPSFETDLASLTDPSRRLEYAQVEAVALALRNTGVFSFVEVSA